MKAKSTILIAASLFLITATQAQYRGGYADRRDQQDQSYYNNSREQAYYDHDRNRAYYNNNRDPVYYIVERRDWREIEYQRHRREHRDFRMDRRVFYGDHCGAYPYAPVCAPHHVVVYGY